MQVVVGSNPHGGELVVGAGRVVSGGLGRVGALWDLWGGCGRVEFFLKKNDLDGATCYFLTVKLKLLL